MHHMKMVKSTDILEELTFFLDPEGGSKFLQNSDSFHHFDMGQYLKDYIEYCLPRRSCV